MNKIVVLGGSFNPPTLAHELLMKNAIREIDADLGIFVPSSDAYVKRKMKKVKHDNQVYSEWDREHMLNVVCDKIGKSVVDACEFGDDGRGYTYKTLCKLQEKYPNSELYFVCGADKLNIIHKWHSIEDLLSKFKILVTAREEDNPIEQIQNNNVLKRFKDRFVVMKQPSGIDSISSTQARRLFNHKSKDISKVCDPVVTYCMELAKFE